MNMGYEDMWGMLYVTSAWVSALLVLLYRAMREASECGTGDSIRLPRFFVYSPNTLYCNKTAETRKSIGTQNIINFYEKVFIWLDGRPYDGIHEYWICVMQQ